MPPVNSVPLPEPTGDVDRSLLPGPSGVSSAREEWPDGHPAAACGHAMGLLGVQIFVEKLCELFDLDMNREGFALDEVIDAVQGLITRSAADQPAKPLSFVEKLAEILRVDMQAEGFTFDMLIDAVQTSVNLSTTTRLARGEGVAVRALLGLTPDTTESGLLDTLAERLASRLDVTKLPGMPPDLPREVALRLVQAAVEAYTTPKALVAPGEPSTADLERFTRDMDKAIVGGFQTPPAVSRPLSPDTQRLVDEIQALKDVIIGSLFGQAHHAEQTVLPEAPPSVEAAGPAYEVIRQPNGMLAVLDLNTRVYALQDAVLFDVMDLFCDLVADTSFEWLAASLNDVVTRGERWGLLQVIGRPEVLSAWRKDRLRHAAQVVTTVELSSGLAAGTSGIRQQHRGSSSSGQFSQENPLPETGAGTKISGSASSNDELSRSEESTSESAWSESLWRTGRHVGRTVYQQQDSDPSRKDKLIGVMDTPALANLVVEAVNSHRERRQATTASNPVRHDVHDLT